MQQVEHDGSQRSFAEDDIEPHDCYCPKMGETTTRYNYWQHKCDARQKDKDQQRDCYPKCKHTKTVKPNTKKNTGEKNRKPTRSDTFSYLDKGLTVNEIMVLLGKSESTIRGYVAEWRKGVNV